MPYSTQPQAIDRAADAERGAYNQAFAELGLEWYWDERTTASCARAPATSPASRRSSRPTTRTCCTRTTVARLPMRSKAFAAA